MKRTAAEHGGRRTAQESAETPAATAAAPVPSHATADGPAARDLVIDLARVFSILVVVVAHLLMIGVGHDASGALVVSRPLEAQGWFAAATWAGQVMPLFFVAGGFTGLAAWRSLQRRGGDWADFVRGRAIRLATPALPLFAAFTLGIAIARIAGVPPTLLATISAGAGSPLWFLAAFLISQCLLPYLAHWHERAPRGTLVVLTICAAVVDAARINTGLADLGLLNLLFVWLFVQQLGFWYADGWFRDRGTWTLLGIVAGAYLGLGVVVAAGWYSPDMLDNLNPATLPLMLLGIAQAGLLTLLHRPLAGFMRLRPARATVSFVGGRAMTLYLWHLPVIVGIEGLSLAIPGATPVPGTSAWWLSRILVFVLTLAIVFAASTLLVRFERFPTTVRKGYERPAAAVIVVAAAFAAAPPFLVLQWHLDLVVAGIGTTLLAASTLLMLPRHLHEFAVETHDPHAPRTS